MRDFDFMSNNTYIYLPTKKNPKVALAIDDKEITKNSFELYNPFSSKAIFFKRVVFFLYTKFNSIIKIFSTKKKVSSKFISYLEEKLNQKIITSIYYATAKDKIVLQVQSLDGEILGYLKYPINYQGYKNLKREIKAYENLSEHGIVQNYIFKDIYNDKPFIFLSKIEGSIKELKDNEVNDLLQNFYKNEKYKLSEHPRINKLKKQLRKCELYSYLEILIKLIDESNLEYFICFEHGDFTPWNIVEKKDGFVPFDFEYFITNGMEYFDLIKYYYQIGTLLRHYNEEELINFVFDKLKIDENFIIFKIYLIKEILIKTKEDHNYDFEKRLLVRLEKTWISF